MLPEEVMPEMSWEKSYKNWYEVQGWGCSGEYQKGKTLKRNHPKDHV